MHSFTITDILLFLGISQGVFLAITLSLVHDRNKLANQILSLMLITACVMLIGRVFHAKFQGALFSRVAFFADTLIFVFGPLLYIYIRRLVFNETPSYKIQKIHFLPALLHLLAFSWSLFYSGEQLQEFIVQGKLNLFFFIVEVAGLLSFIFYTIRSYQLVALYQKRKKDMLSYDQNIQMYVRVLLIGVSVFLCLWILSFLNLYFLRKRELLFISYHMVWISIPVIIYSIGFFSLRQPEIFRIPLLKPKVEKKERLSGDELEILKKNLENLMVNKKVYLNNTLTLKDLSDELETSTNNLSWVLNNIHQCSFYDYINTYRVQEFISKIQKGEHHNHTILALSLDSGFNSKSTFNKAFKMAKNDTPSNYIKGLKVS